MQAGLVTTRLPLTEIPDETLRRMFEYWQSRGGSGRMPSRADIDPLEFGWALGIVCLLDVERNPLRFRYRVDGSIIADRHGEDLTGRTTDEVRPQFYAAMLREHFSEVVESQRPSLFRIAIRYEGRAKTYLRLALPLSTDGTNVDKILTVSERVAVTPEARSGVKRDDPTR